MEDFIVFAVLEMSGTGLWTSTQVCGIYILEGIQNLAGQVPEHPYLTWH